MPLAESWFMKIAIMLGLTIAFLLAIGFLLYAVKMPWPKLPWPWSPF
jgi:hypothetical protein